MKYKLPILVVSILLFIYFLVWAHHMFMSGVNPFISNFFVIPLAIIFLIGANYLSKKIGKITSNKVAKFFSIAFVLFLIYGLLSGIFLGNSAIDIQMHDTYFVIAHFHIFILFSLIFAFYAIAYFVIPKMIKRKLNETLGLLHFALTTIGILSFICHPINYVGMAGVPRRYYRFENIDPAQYFENINMIFTLSLGTVIFLAE